MIDFVEDLRTQPLLSDGAMGSYLFERTGRISETNHVYEALNVDRADLVHEVHLTYLQAGARCLTTNTFSANRTHLEPLDQGKRLVEINWAAVDVAHQAIEAFRAQSGIELPFYVLGAVGPTSEGHESPHELNAIYRDQIGALIEGGVDALQLETFSSLPHVMALLDLIQTFENPPPVIVQMALHQDDNGWDQNPQVFVKTVADMGAQVVGVNCCAPWEVTHFVDEVEDLAVVKDGHVLLSAMPNAGGFQRIGHRYMSHVNPEFMGKFARTLAERRVCLLGGCCEVHPAHINEMHNYLQGRQVGSRAVQLDRALSKAPVGDAEKKQNGRFSHKIKNSEFAVSVEMLPARGTAPKTLQSKVDFVAELAASGLADALDVTDGSRGIPLMPPGDFIGIVRERLGWTRERGDGLELIPHYTTRDLNVMGLQSRLIGYHARRIHNVLFVTGDPPKMSPTYPRSTAVFDLDSVAMIHYAHSGLNAGVDFGGQPLGKHRDPRTHFTIGSGFEPEALNLEYELERLERKIDAGADYILTQPAFRFEPLACLEAYRSRVSILVGLAILMGLEHARRLGQVPGVVIPDDVYLRLAAFESPQDQAKVGRDIAVEQLCQAVQQGWAGAYLMSPASHHPILDVLKGGLA